MRVRHDPILAAAMTVGCAAALLLGCSSGTGPSSATSVNPQGSANTTATGDGGTAQGSGNSVKALLCTPSAAEVSACQGLAAGAACSLTRAIGDHDGDADDDAGVVSIAGTCRSSFDGSEVACIPTPPAPPAALTDACSGKTPGTSCTVQGPRGTLTGICFDPHGSGTLICGPIHTPPQPLVDACTGKAAGDACPLRERRDGGTVDGVCGNGPTGMGPLACGPVRDPSARLAAACTGLDAGTACTIGERRWGLEGTCTAPAGGGAALCLLPCPEVPRRFHHGPWGPGGMHPLQVTPDGGH
jgi:hypothetical protein